MPLLQSSAHRVADPAAASLGPLTARWRTLTLAAVGPPLVGYVVLVALVAIVSALATNSAFATARVFAAAAPVWLAACHVPLEISGHPLGVLPLLLTVLVVSLAARSASSAAGRMGLQQPGRSWQVTGAVGGGHAIVGVIIAASLGSSGVVAAPALAFFVCGGVGAVGSVLGLAKPCGILDAVLARADFVVRRGLRAGLLGLLALVAGGSVTYVVGLALSASSAGALFRAVAPGAGSGFGLLLLSLCYLPNALVGGVSFATGAGVTIGPVAVSPFHFTGGVLPAFPLFAALPESFAGWWPLFLVFPLAAGLLVGWSLRHASLDPVARVRMVGVSAVVVAAAFLVLAGAASGSLGGPGFGSFTVPAGLLALTAMGWIAVPGAIVAWFGGRDVSDIAAAPEDVLEDSTV